MENLLKGVGICLFVLFGIVAAVHEAKVRDSIPRPDYVVATYESFREWKQEVDEPNHWIGYETAEDALDAAKSFIAQDYKVRVWGVDASRLPDGAREMTEREYEENIDERGDEALGQD